jgi:hypothetical protein
MRYNFFYLLPFLLASACTPPTLQNARLVDYNHGRAVYELDGYTGPGEVNPGDSGQHIEYSLAKACPNGIKIINADEQPSYNGIAKFLYWRARVECR